MEALGGTLKYRGIIEVSSGNIWPIHTGTKPYSLFLMVDLHQDRRRQSGRAASAGPLFGPSMLSAVSLFSRFGSFYILSLILFNLPQFIDAIINKARCMCHQ